MKANIPPALPEAPTCRALVPYDPFFAAWQGGDHSGARFERQTFRWGAPYEVSVTLTMLRGYGGGPTWFADYNPRYQPQLTCTTCPFWGVSEGGGNYCAHPFYLEVVGCPQTNGNPINDTRRKNKASAASSCPMVGKRDWRMRRRFRVSVKCSRLLKYYGDDLDRVPRWVREGYWAGIRLRSRMWLSEDGEPFHPSRIEEQTR